MDNVLNIYIDNFQFQVPIQIAVGLNFALNVLQSKSFIILDGFICFKGNMNYKCKLNFAYTNDRQKDRQTM